MLQTRIVQLLEELSGYDNIKDNMDIDLLDNDILDSFTCIQLINRLEEEYTIEIQPTQVYSDTWRHIESIARLVESLRTANEEEPLHT